jgi:putative hemolysin
MLKRALGHFLGLAAFDRTCERIRERTGDRTFAQTAIEVLRLGIDLPDEQRSRIPAAGPLIVVANHPTGAMEGLVLPAILDSIRPDAKTLAHVWFGRCAELARSMFLVDPAAEGRARATTRAALANAVRWVREGGSLLLFPAGEVARYDPQRRRVCDPAWRSGVARIVRATRATVLPVRVEARNGPAYHLLSMIHKRLGVLWLMRELLAKRGTTMRVRIGRPIPFAELAAEKGDDALTARLRQSVDALEPRGTGRRRSGSALRVHGPVGRTGEEAVG